MTAIVPAPAFSLDSVVLNPPPDGDAVRAIWLYAGTNFDSSTGAQAVLDFCAREGVNRIYCGAYSIWQLGTAQQKNNLRAFIEAAHASGVRVEAEMGDTHWQFDAQKVRDKIDQMLALHTATPTNDADDFDAVHFDVEFWVDPAWNAAGSETERRQIAIDYLNNVLANARTHLDSRGESDMEVAVDLSAHLENADKLPTPFVFNGTTQPFLGHVFDLADDVVIMSYIDFSSGLWNWTNFELDIAVSKGRTIQLGAAIEPVPPMLPINSFADDAPTGFAAMTATLEALHMMLTADQLVALDGFAVFHYNGYASEAPNPHNIADFDGDADADGEDHGRWVSYLSGPNEIVSGLGRDCDLDGDGAITLGDFARFAACFTGDGVAGPVPDACQR
jgi:hypothetical protein